MGSPAGALANPAGTGLALQAPSSDSLTNFIRSIEGLTGAQGQGILGQGLSQTQQGTQAVAPVLDLLTKLTKGDQGDVTEAAQPQIDQITQQFDQIRNLISMQPRGGGKTSALAEAPFKKAGDIQRTEGSMRTAAAGELGSLGTNLAGLGLQEAGIGAGLESTSSGIALTKEGQNYNQPSALSQVLSGLSFGASAAETGAGIAYLLG
jgi:hypothetical protein